MGWRRLLRRHLVSIVCLAVAGAVGAAAIVDHAWKTRRIYRAEVQQWYCEHEATDCGGPSAAGMERHWNDRQIVYEAAVIALGGFAAVRVAFRTVRR